MGESKNNREAFERTVKRVVEHDRSLGKEPSEASTRRFVAGLAREQDSKKDGGAFKGRRK